MVEGRQAEHNNDWPPKHEEKSFYKEIIERLQHIEDSGDRDTIRKINGTLIQATGALLSHLRVSDHQEL